MAAVSVNVQELDQQEDVGYFFNYQGGLQLAGGELMEQRPTGQCSLVASCSKHGLVFWSNLNGANLYAVVDVAVPPTTA